MELYTDVATAYADFTRAAGDSPCFADWAARVVADPEVRAWIERLPPVKQQPNLVFAAARWHGVPAPGPYAALREALLGDDGRIEATILARATQTNEVGRLATLTPVLGRLAAEAGRPLALLEAGASAGVCLYPDRYDYVWSGSGHAGRSVLTGSGGPTLHCTVEGALPAPQRHPPVAWRGGVDLNPLDAGDPDTRAWLRTLVWPEQEERRARLDAALGVVAADPPQLVRGDLLEELPDLVAAAGEHGAVVVFHTAVAAYLPPEDRQRFQELMGGLVADGACRWVSNEGKQVLPAVTATGPVVPEGQRVFVLGVDGQAVAWTHGHGRSLRWLG